MSISIEAHDRICQDLHQQIRSLIVENEKLRAALEQPKRHVSYVCPQCHWSLEQPDRAQAMRDAGYTRRPTLREMAEQPEQPYAEQARRVEQETHGRMRIDPVTGNVSIGTPTEQPEQKPVAWRYALDVSVEGPRWIYSEIDPAEWRDPDMLNWAIETLYTHPPRREWRGLTEDETMHLMNDTAGNYWADEAHIQRFRSAIEAALKERNA